MEAHLYQSGSACQIYLLADGRNCPAADFLSKAANRHPDEFAKLTKLLDHSCAHGLPKNKQKINGLGDGLYEFKTMGGLRLVWFWDAHRVILCSHGFVKKRQSTPPSELETAFRWKKAYELAKKTQQLKFIEDPK
jgi:phage-related protein